jgi:hypothetical protein
LRDAAILENLFVIFSSHFCLAIRKVKNYKRHDILQGIQSRSSEEGIPTHTRALARRLIGTSQWELRYQKCGPRSEARLRARLLLERTATSNFIRKTQTPLSRTSRAERIHHLRDQQILQLCLKSRNSRSLRYVRWCWCGVVGGMVGGGVRWNPAAVMDRNERCATTLFGFKISSHITTHSL